MILDTNTYSALQNAEPQLLELMAAADLLRLPVTVIAELKAGFLHGNRTHENEDRLAEFLARSGAEILQTSTETAEIYAELQELCWRKGRSPGQNDMWIAAMAIEADDTLVTYDNDFEVFKGRMGDQLIILTP